MQSNEDSSSYIYKSEFVKHLFLSPILLQITLSQFYCHFYPYVRTHTKKKNIFYLNLYFFTHPRFKSITPKCNLKPLSLCMSPGCSQKKTETRNYGAFTIQYTTTTVLSNVRHRRWTPGGQELLFIHFSVPKVKFQSVCN